MNFMKFGTENLYKKLSSKLEFLNFGSVTVKLHLRAYVNFYGRKKNSKKVLNGNFHTVRQVGRPRTRWADVIQRYARQLLGIRGWRNKAANRDEWRLLMREAKVRKVCHN